MKQLPWKEIKKDGLFIGHTPRGESRSNIWLYWVLPNRSLAFLDDPELYRASQQLKDLFIELGRTSRKSPFTSSNLKKRVSNYRQFHQVSLTWTAYPLVPQTSTPLHYNFLEQLWNFEVFHGITFIGTRLMLPLFNKGVPERNVKKIVERLSAQLLGENDTDSLELYQEDLDYVKSVFSKYGLRVPNREELSRLTAWYNGGKSNGALIRLDQEYVEVLSNEQKRYEFSWLQDFGTPYKRDLRANWIADAMNHRVNAVGVSIKGYIEPAAIISERLRKSSRKRVANIEVTESVDLPKSDQYGKLNIAMAAEQYYTETQEPALVETTITLVAEKDSIESSPQTYRDYLRDRYGMVIVPGYYRQLSALEEFLPTSIPTNEGNVFRQDISLDTLAYAGAGSFADLGDKDGIWLGFAEPEMSMVYLDPSKAAAGTGASQNPMVAILGEPGSGKTFLLQLIAIQSALLGRTTFFENPKPDDDLSPLVNLIADFGVTAEQIRMDELEGVEGSLDPFGYTDPDTAAHISASHLMTVLQGGFSMNQESYLESGLKNGAKNGAKCVWEALKYVDDPEIKKSVIARMDASSVFRLGIATKPASEHLRLSRQFTLVQFSQNLTLDTSNVSQMTLMQKDQLAAFKLVSAIGIEMLLKSKNAGTFIADEAHHLLSQESGQKFLSMLGRYGRSQQITAFMATHKASEIQNLESFIGTTIALQIVDQREAQAALEMLKLTPSPELTARLATFGPKNPTESNPRARGARAFMRDSDMRTGVLAIENIPEWLRRQLSTSSTDRVQRRVAERI